MNDWYNLNSDTNLVENEVHIWISCLNTHQEKLKHLYLLLSDLEKKRSEQFKFYNQRKLFIASHGFLHSVLSYYIDTPAKEIKFSQGENGKPSIVNEQNQQQLQFNLSHSNHIAILAICKQKNIGVDIEYSERETNWRGIIRHFFAQKEQDEIFKLPEEFQKKAFFQVWARKEAYIKMTGQGLSLPLAQFEVSVPPKPAAFLTNINNLYENHIYKMQDISLPNTYNNYHACLSTDFDFEKITQNIWIVN